MKKTISMALISILATGSVVLACDSNSNNSYNTIKYTTQGEASVKSDSILVQVIGYATTTLQNQDSIKSQISDKVKNIIDADWKVKNLDQDTSKSGAINIKLELQARISQDDLNKLQKVLNNQDKSSNQKLVVNVLDYNPPSKEVEKAKQKLMIKLYKNTKEYLKNFNEQTNSNYTIQSINYTGTNIYKPKNNIMLMKKASSPNGGMGSSNENPVAVSQDINIKANVTFMEK